MAQAAPPSEPPVVASSGAAVVALLFVQVFFGGLAVAGKLAFAGWSPIGVAALRVSASAVALWLLHAALVRERVARRHLPRLAVYSLFGIVGNQILFMLGLQHTDPVAATVLVTTIPVWTLLVAIMLKVERPGPRKVTGVALATAGVAVLVGVGWSEFGPTNALGNLMITTNALSYAIYLVIARDLLRIYQPITVAAWTFTFGAIVIAPLGAFDLVHEDWEAVPRSAWLALGYIILFATLGTYLLNNWALTKVTASTVAVYIYLQPVVSAILAYLVFGQVPTMRMLAGALLIFGGVAFAAMARKSGNVPVGRTRI